MLSPYQNKQSMSSDLCPQEHCKRETEAHNDLMSGPSSRPDTHLSSLSPPMSRQCPHLATAMQICCQNSSSLQKGQDGPRSHQEPSPGCIWSPPGGEEVALPLHRINTCPGFGSNRSALVCLTPECQSAKRFRLHISPCLNKNSLCLAPRLGIILDKMFSTAVCSAAGDTLG